MKPSRLLGLVLLAGSTAAACGSKSGLLSAERGIPAGAGGSTGGATTGGTSAGGVGGLDSGADAAPPLPDCIYVQHGEPIVIFTYGEGVYTPQLAKLGDGPPARFAFSLLHGHFWHPELRVAEVSITPEWPGGVSVTHDMLLYGIDAHAPGQMVPGTNGPSELALLYYHADEASPNVVPGVKFRRFDTGAWKPFDELFVEKLGGYAYSIAPGPTLSDVKGNGYGVTWRSAVEGDASSPLVTARAALLDASGNIVSGPVDLAPPSAYPGTGATLAFTTERWLVAANPKQCPGTSAECDAQLVVGRLDAETFVVTGSVPPLPGLRARTPLLRSTQGATWVAWREQAASAKPGEDLPSTLRLVSASPSGALAPVTWQTEAHPDAGAELSVSDQGVLLVWGERVDQTLPQNQVGHSRLRLRQLSKSGGELQELVVPTSSLTTGTAYAVATLAEPRALLLAWTAEGPTQGQAHLARFDCVEQLQD